MLDIAAPALKTVQSVERALDILSIVAESGPKGVRVVDVVRASGLVKPTAQRLLGVLARSGFIDRQDQRYVAGVALYRLGLLARERFQIGVLARPGLLRIAKETGDTVFLTVRANNNSICAEREIGDFPIKTLVVEVGDLRPLGIGSGSLAILSALPDAEIERLLVHNAQALKAFPRFDRDEMLQHIAATRTRSYSLIDGQLVAGMSAIGVVIRDPAGQAIAAISVASIAPRLEGTRLDTIVDLVRGEAAQLEQTLIATQRRLPEQAKRARAAA